MSETSANDEQELRVKLHVIRKGVALGAIGEQHAVRHYLLSSSARFPYCIAGAADFCNLRFQSSAARAGDTPLRRQADETLARRPCASSAAPALGAHPTQAIILCNGLTCRFVPVELEPPAKINGEIATGPRRLQDGDVLEICGRYLLATLEVVRAGTTDRAPPSSPLPSVARRVSAEAQRRPSSSPVRHAAASGVESESSVFGHHLAESSVDADDQDEEELEEEELEEEELEDDVDDANGNEVAEAQYLAERVPRSSAHASSPSRLVGNASPVSSALHSRVSDSDDGEDEGVESGARDSDSDSVGSDGGESDDDESADEVDDDAHEDLQRQREVGEDRTASDEEDDGDDVDDEEESASEEASQPRRRASAEPLTKRRPFALRQLEIPSRRMAESLRPASAKRRTRLRPSTSPPPPPAKRRRATQEQRPRAKPKAAPAKSTAVSSKVAKVPVELMPCDSATFQSAWAPAATKRRVRPPTRIA